jgi:sugar-specific transcriptional regulator TrmB
MSLEKNLETIGLSEKEANVYLALLELGHASVQDISKKAKVNRATTYVILDALIKKGLCSTFSKEKKTYYGAETPERLNSLFAIQKKEIEEKQRILDTLMPQLEVLNNSRENKPSVRFYEGKESLQTLINDMYTTKDKLVRSIFSADNVEDIFSEEERTEARERRLKLGIKFKTIYTSTRKGAAWPVNPLTERFRVSENKFPISNDIAIYDGKVRIASLGKKLSGVIIEDQEIYNTFVSIFELAWEAAKNMEQK